MSQVGEYVDDIELVKPLIAVLVQLVINDPHPQIRFACYHCLGQLAQDMSPDFQSRFGDDVLYVLINGIQDEVPRVKSHALCALTNFNEGTIVEVILDKSDLKCKEVLPEALPWLSHVMPLHRTNVSRLQIIQGRHEVI